MVRLRSTALAAHCGVPLMVWRVGGTLEPVHIEDDTLRSGTLPERRRAMHAWSRWTRGSSPRSAIGSWIMRLSLHHHSVAACPRSALLAVREDTVLAGELVHPGAHVPGFVEEAVQV